MLPSGFKDRNEHFHLNTFSMHLEFWIENPPSLGLTIHFSYWLSIVSLWQCNVFCFIHDAHNNYKSTNCITAITWFVYLSTLYSTNVTSYC